MDLEETRAFLAVVDNGSFKAAAETVRQPRATLRRRVEALEARAGVPLLERSRTGVLPTAAGKLLARQGRVMLRETTALLGALRELGDEPSGDICLGVPTTAPIAAIAQIASDFHARFPRTRLHLHICDDPIAELGARVDVALTYANEIPAGRWRKHALARINLTLRASRDYLQCYGIPQDLDALGDHKLLALAEHVGPHRWPSHEGGSFTIEASMTTTKPDVLLTLAKLGCGIALLPDTIDEEEPLLPVLEGTVGCRRELFAVVPEVSADTPKLRAFLDHLLASREELGVEVRQTSGAGLQGLHSPAI